MIVTTYTVNTRKLLWYVYEYFKQSVCRMYKTNFSITNYDMRALKRVIQTSVRLYNNI